MNTKERIEQLKKASALTASLEKKQQIDAAITTLVDQMIADKEYIKTLYDWLQKNYPQHPKHDEGLSVYEKKCDEFLATHGIYEHEFTIDREKTEEEVFAMEGTYIDQYGSKQTTLGDVRSLFDM